MGTKCKEFGAHAQWCAQSRCRCGRGEPSPGADVGGVRPVPGADVAAASAVPVQMWRHAHTNGRRMFLMKTQS